MEMRRAQGASKAPPGLDSFPAVSPNAMRRGWLTLAFGLSLAAPVSVPAKADPAPQVAGRDSAPEALFAARAKRLPRKVLLGTAVSGDRFTSEPLEKRLDLMEQTVERIAGRAERDFPGRRLDLILLTEYFLANPGDSAEAQAVPLESVQTRAAACAKRHGCYLITPMVLREGGSSPFFSNAAVLYDREGKLVGMYRKVHPVAFLGSDLLEGGLTPGRDFPVFDCDFGRLGIQICFDMLYEDGWRALARQGAEIVALPSASAETIRPLTYAREYQYYILSSSPRIHACCISPVGVIDSEATQEGEVLVHEIDLSYEILHWEAQLEEGEALRRKFGPLVGFHYYRSEDKGLFWSNDPSMSIGAMVGSLGLLDEAANIERVRKIQDTARGGPPALP
jgi:predicted amidohydrolase